MLETRLEKCTLRYSGYMCIVHHITDATYQGLHPVAAISLPERFDLFSSVVSIAIAIESLMSHSCHYDFIYIVVAKLLKAISSTFSLVHLLKWQIWPNCNLDFTREKFQNGKDSAFVNFGECFIQSGA